MIALPPVSYDYTLCHLYPAFGLTVLVLVHESKHGQIPVELTLLLWCFLLLFTSQTVLSYGTFHLNGLIKALCLLISLILLIRFPIDDEVVAASISPSQLSVV